MLLGFLNISYAWHGNLAGQVAFPVAVLHFFLFLFFFGRERYCRVVFVGAGTPYALVFAFVAYHYQGHDMTSCCWLVVMGSERFASPIMGIFCGGLNAYCMRIWPLFLRTSGSSGVLKAFLLERNRQLSCNPKKKKKKGPKASSNSNT